MAVRRSTHTLCGSNPTKREPRSRASGTVHPNMGIKIPAGFESGRKIQVCALLLMLGACGEADVNGPSKGGAAGGTSGTSGSTGGSDGAQGQSGSSVTTTGGDAGIEQPRRRRFRISGGRRRRSRWSGRCRRRGGRWRRERTGLRVFGGDQPLRQLAQRLEHQRDRFSPPAT